MVMFTTAQLNLMAKIAMLIPKDSIERFFPTYFFLSNYYTKDNWYYKHKDELKEFSLSNKEDPDNISGEPVEDAVWELAEKLRADAIHKNLEIPGVPGCEKSLVGMKN